MTKVQPRPEPTDQMGALPSSSSSVQLPQAGTTVRFKEPTSFLLLLIANLGLVFQTFLHYYVFILLNLH